jgi:hypothetical protein
VTKKQADKEPSGGSEILLYHAEDGAPRIEGRLDARADHCSGELGESATCKDYLQVRMEGGREVRLGDQLDPGSGIKDSLTPALASKGCHTTLCSLNNTLRWVTGAPIARPICMLWPAPSNISL